MLGKMRKNWKSLRLALLLAVGITAVAAPITLAMTYTWNGGPTGEWRNGLNWGGSGYPGYLDNTDVAVFNTDKAVIMLSRPDINLNLESLQSLAALNVSADTTLNLSADLEARGLSFTDGASLTVVTTGAESLYNHGPYLREPDTFSVIADTIEIPENSTLEVTGPGVLNMNNGLNDDGELQPIVILNWGKFIVDCRDAWISHTNSEAKVASLDAVIDNKGTFIFGNSNGNANDIDNSKQGTWQVNAYEGSTVEFAASNANQFALNLLESYSSLKLQDNATFGDITGNGNILNVTGNGDIRPNQIISADIRLGMGDDNPVLSTGDNHLRDVALAVNKGATLLVVGEERSTDVTLTSGAKLNAVNNTALRNVIFASQDAILSFGNSEVSSQDPGLDVSGAVAALEGFTVYPNTAKITGDLPVMLIRANTLSIDIANIICSPDLDTPMALFVRDNTLYLGQATTNLDVTDEAGNTLMPMAIESGDQTCKEVTISRPQTLTFTSSSWHDEQGEVIEIETESPVLCINGEESTDITGNSNGSFTLPASKMGDNDEIIITIRATLKKDQDADDASISSSNNDIEPLELEDDNTVESEPIFLIIGKGVLRGNLTASSTDIEVNETVVFNIDWTNKFIEAPAEKMDVVWTISNDRTGPEETLPVLSKNLNEFCWTFPETGKYMVTASGILDNDRDLMATPQVAIYVTKLPKLDSGECNAGSFSILALLCATPIALIRLKRKK